MKWNAAVKCLSGLLVVGAVGCTSGSASRMLKPIAPPRGGAPMPNKAFEAVEAEETPGPQGKTSNFLLPFPLVSRKYRFDVNAERTRAEASDYSMVTLGVPYQYLPFQFSFSKYIYEKGKPEPVSSLERRYSPFYSYATKKGIPDEDLVIDVQGVPLFAEWGKEKGYAWYFDDLVKDRKARRDFEFFAALWWLGPSWYKVTETNVDNPEYRYDGRFFVPLLLGRALGFALWSDYYIASENGDETTKTIGHGPLGGYIAYFDQHVKSVSEKRSRSLRLVLGGLLWLDQASQRDGEPRNSVSGPLWGLFGAGRHKGDPAIYLFRLPIRVGSADAAS